MRPKSFSKEDVPGAKVVESERRVGRGAGPPGRREGQARGRPAERPPRGVASTLFFKDATLLGQPSKGMAMGTPTALAMGTPTALATGTPRGPPAGAAADAHEAPQTRPMPIVPDVAAYGGDQDDDRGAARPSSPPLPKNAPNPEPMPDAAEPAPKPQKKSAGRDLSAAIGVGVGLGAVIVASLFVVKAVFVGVIAVAVVVGLWELTKRLDERKGIRAPLVPLALGGAAMVVAGYVRGAEGAWVAMALTALAVLVWRMTEPPENYLQGRHGGRLRRVLRAVPGDLRRDDADGGRRAAAGAHVPAAHGRQRHRCLRGRLALRPSQLAPRISPGKTREGLLGAVAFAMVAGALCLEFLIDGGAWWQGLLLGLAVAVSATLGDLGESMIKRDLGIKDMGTLLPDPPRRGRRSPTTTGQQRARNGWVARLRLDAVVPYCPGQGLRAPRAGGPLCS
ncbi:hypothetical protein SALBM311S_06862 [Streptomyces alboniger]